MVDPPTVDQTIQIIRGLRDKYEAHHGAKYSDDSIVQAVTTYFATRLAGTGAAGGSD